MYIALCSYKALTELSEKRLVSTEPHENTSYRASCQTVPKHLSLSDHDRPLDKVGEEDALHMGKLIKDMCDLTITSSTALRAKTTAELVAKRCSYQGDIILNQSRSAFINSLLCQKTTSRRRQREHIHVNKPCGNG